MGFAPQERDWGHPNPPAPWYSAGDRDTSGPKKSGQDETPTSCMGGRSTHRQRGRFGHSLSPTLTPTAWRDQ